MIAESLQDLAQSLEGCEDCNLHKERTQVVFGVGNSSADLMLVGEGPGFHEDQQGEPFVGRAGKLLDELLGSIGLDRSMVYIANVVKCRPPRNRDPLADEILSCSRFLMEQIRIVSPRVVCTLGNFSTKLLAETERGITSVHGQVKQVELGGVSLALFPVFHPAAALYTSANRSVLEEDFQKLDVLLKGGREAPVVSPEPDDGPGTHAETEQLPLW